MELSHEIFQGSFLVEASTNKPRYRVIGKTLVFLNSPKLVHKLVKYQYLTRAKKLPKINKIAHISVSDNRKIYFTKKPKAFSFFNISI